MGGESITRQSACRWAKTHDLAGHPAEVEPAGPAIGGFAYAVDPAVPYATMAAFWIIGSTTAAVSTIIEMPSSAVPSRM